MMLFPTETMERAATLSYENHIDQVPRMVVGAPMVRALGLDQGQPSAVAVVEADLGTDGTPSNNSRLIYGTRLSREPAIARAQASELYNNLGCSILGTDMEPWGGPGGISFMQFVAAPPTTRPAPMPQSVDLRVYDYLDNNGALHYQDIMVMRRHLVHLPADPGPRRSRAFVRHLRCLMYLACRVRCGQFSFFRFSPRGVVLRDFFADGLSRHENPRFGRYDMLQRVDSLTRGRDATLVDATMYADMALGFLGDTANVGLGTEELSRMRSPLSEQSRQG